MFKDYASSGGNATIYIRYAADFQNHKKGDIVTIFNNTNFELNFGNEGKDIKRNQNLMTNYKSSFKTLTIRPRDFVGEIYDFLAFRSSNNSTQVPVIQKVVTDDNGEGFLDYKANNITLWNDEGEKITNFSISDDVILQNLEPSEEYIADYYYEINPEKTYNIKEKNLPYFHIEIVGYINTGGQDRKMLLDIPRAGLTLDAILSYEIEEVVRVDLDFNIVDGKAKVVFF